MGPPNRASEKNGRKGLAGPTCAHHELVISTEAGNFMWPGPYGEWGSRKHVLSSLDQSLGRMGVEYVDILYSHRPEPRTPMEETMRALDTAVRSGKALYVGVSDYTPEQTVEAARASCATSVRRC